MKKELVVKGYNRLLPYFLHYSHAKLLREFGCKTVLDMGGNGRLKHYFNGEIITVNLKSGTDALKTGFPDKKFDACMSNAVLEHIAPDDQLLFIKESIRMSSFISHWFPYGEYAILTESLRAKYKDCRHRCWIPDSRIVDYIIKNNKQVIVKPFLTVGELLQYLGIMSNSLCNPQVFEHLHKYSDKPYGILIYGNIE